MKTKVQNGEPDLEFIYNQSPLNLPDFVTHIRDLFPKKWFPLPVQINWTTSIFTLAMLQKKSAFTSFLKFDFQLAVSNYFLIYLVSLYLEIWKGVLIVKLFKSSRSIIYIVVWKERIPFMILITVDMYMESIEAFLVALQVVFP